LKEYGQVKNRNTKILTSNDTHEALQQTLNFLADGNEKKALAGLNKTFSTIANHLITNWL
jgi:hypothetical protein